MFRSLMPTPWFFVSLFIFCLLSIGCANEHAGPSPAAAQSEPEPEPKPEEDVVPVEDEISGEELIANADVYFATCGGETRSMAEVLLPITARMEAQNIPYKRSQEPVDEWRDCSGNFLRLSSYVASACAGNDDHLAAPPGVTDYTPDGDNKAPQNKGARSSRGIGKWYHDQGRFIPIFYDDVTDITQPPQDLIDKRNLIKPGAVLWYSRGMPTRLDGLDSLWISNTRNLQINHMGTVTEVERDEDGNVIRYTIYHGHGRDGNPASVTRNHYWVWPKTFTKEGSAYPPFGYWAQYLVGIGTLLPTTVPPPLS